MINVNSSYIIVVLCIMMFTVPYYIIQPSTDDTVQIVSPTAATNFEVTCSLNVIIPVGMTVTWLHNGDFDNTITNAAATTNTVQLTVKGKSQAGIYQCAFNYTTGYTVRRNITVLSTCNIITTYVAL